MKEPQIDVYSTSTQQFLNRVGWKKKFLKLWGTTTIDGVKVLNKKHNFYPHPTNKDLFLLLNMYNQVKGTSMKGIDSAWITLSPSKAKIPELTRLSLIQDLDFNVPTGRYELVIGRKISVVKTINELGEESHSTVSGGDPLNLFTNTYIKQDGTYDASAIEQSLKANFLTLFNNYFMEGLSDSEIENLVTVTVLGGSNAFLVTVIDATSSYSENGSTSSTRLNNAITLTLSITNVGVVASTDPIIDTILKFKDRVKADNMTIGDVLSMAYTRRLPVTNEFWYKDRLRASVFEVDTLKSKDCIELVTKSIDTGYKKKKVPWYKKIIGIVVFIVVFYFTGGLGGTFASFAFSFSVATLAVALTSAAMARWGDTVGAEAVGKFAKTVSSIGVFVAIVSVINSISNVIVKAVTEAAKAGATQSLTQMLVDKIKDFVISTFNRYTSQLSVSRAVELGNRLFGLYTRNKLEKLNDKVISTSNLLKKQEEEMKGHEIEEQQRLYHMGLMFSKVYTENIQQDMSEFAIDYKYEPTRYPNQRGTLHIGNICRRYFF